MLNSLLYFFLDIFVFFLNFLLHQNLSYGIILLNFFPQLEFFDDFYHFDDRFNSSADYRELLLRPMFEECHRVLTDVGNIVIHVEAKISHHVRIVLDDIFGEKRYRQPQRGP